MQFLDTWQYRDEAFYHEAYWLARIDTFQDSPDTKRPDLKLIQSQIKKYKIKYFWLKCNNEIRKA